MAEREPAGPFCFECVWFPEPPADLEESAPDRVAGRSLTADFLCPRIRRRVVPTYAAHCPDYQNPRRSAERWQVGRADSGGELGADQARRRCASS